MEETHTLGEWRRASERAVGVYASKVSYGVTSDELTSNGARIPPLPTHARNSFVGIVCSVKTCTHTRVRGSGYARFEGAPPPPPSGAQELICGSGKRNRSNNIPYYDVTRDTGSRVRVSRAYRVDRAPVPCTYLACLSLPLVRVCVIFHAFTRAWKVYTGAFACPNNVRGRAICS